MSLRRPLRQPRRVAPRVPRRAASGRGGALRAGGAAGGAERRSLGIPWMDGLHFAPPKKPWKDSIFPVNYQ